MSFLDDLFKELIYKPPSSSVWDNLNMAASQPLSLDGIVPTMQGAPTAPANTPNTADIADAIANQQLRRQPFQIFDIIPFKLTNDSFAFQLEISRMADITGYEDDNLNTNANVGTYKSTAWRTIALPIMGDFLKIEFLPGKINYLNYVQGLVLNAGGAAVATPTQLKEDTGYSAQTAPAQQNPAAGPHSLAPTNLGYEKELSRQILVQFDSVSNPVHIANDGMVFHVPFQTVYIHCKTGCANFRVTAGYQTSITERGDHTLMNSNPAFGPGHGMWSNPARHCSPFALTNNGAPAQGATVTAFVKFPAISSTTGAKIDTLFNQNLATLKIQSGVAVGWITGFSCTITCQAQAIAAIGSVWIQITRASGLNPKILLVQPFYVISGGAGPMNTRDYIKNINIPIRFTLKPQDKLEIWGIRDSADGATGNPNMLWAMEGYVYGKVFDPRLNTNVNNAGDFGNLSNLPGLALDQITTDPFPLDQLEDGFTY